MLLLMDRSQEDYWIKTWLRIGWVNFTAVLIDVCGYNASTLAWRVTQDGSRGIIVKGFDMSSKMKNGWVWGGEKASALSYIELWWLRVHMTNGNDQNVKSIIVCWSPLFYVHSVSLSIPMIFLHAHGWCWFPTLKGSKAAVRGEIVKTRVRI